MPLLHPQINAHLSQPITSGLGDEYDALLNFPGITDDSNSGIAPPLLDGLNSIIDTKFDIRVDPECNEDLREFYDVLPDKSVQCKICDKVLKAGVSFILVFVST
jgi:hypothetical protein